MSLLRDCWAFLRVRKMFWLLPLLIVLVLFGVLVVFSRDSTTAPFIYTLF